MWVCENWKLIGWKWGEETNYVFPILWSKLILEHNLSSKDKIFLFHTTEKRELKM
jgi:hypothetical protein